MPSELTPRPFHVSLGENPGAGGGKGRGISRGHEKNCIRAGSGKRRPETRRTRVHRRRRRRRRRKVNPPQLPQHTVTAISVSFRLRRNYTASTLFSFSLYTRECKTQSARAARVRRRAAHYAHDDDVCARARARTGCSRTNTSIVRHAQAENQHCGARGRARTGVRCVVLSERIHPSVVRLLVLPPLYDYVARLLKGCRPRVCRGKLGASRRS